ncbi:hypothetical protein [Roseobacter sp. HKCCA0434]|uniref:hypothetical protein n=1 Tax=Roseobacter sp. HKCCA0434 TaxID=3079297 RepID=UPI002905D398|nr:hypothetical protein [Roseobacter sp. HKCCA0434]
MYDLLLKSLLLMPRVFLRTLPVALLVALIYFGLIDNTSNPLWQIVFVLLLTTPCIAIIRMAALRAALVAADRTTPPTIAHLTKAQIRLAYGNLLPINVVQSIAMVIIAALVDASLTEGLTQASLEYAKTGSTAGYDEVAANFTTLLQAAGWIASLIAAAGFGVMGVPMAASAANAAEKRPRHDITFGLGWNFWKLALLYLVALFVNAIVAICLALIVLSALTLGDVSFARYVVPAAIVLYVSLHFATTASGAALSYGQLLDQKAVIRDYVKSQIAGPQTSADDLRALRQSRQRG